VAGGLKPEDWYPQLQEAQGFEMVSACLYWGCSMKIAKTKYLNA